MRFEREKERERDVLTKQRKQRRDDVRCDVWRNVFVMASVKSATGPSPIVCSLYKVILASN